MPRSPGSIPSVVQIELLAASTGSSIRSVLGIHRHRRSAFSSPCGLDSLECFPRTGEPEPQPLSEHVLLPLPLLRDDPGGTLALGPSHAALHAALGQGGVISGQTEGGGITGTGIGPQNPGGSTGTIAGGTFHWTALLAVPCSDEIAASAVAGAAHTAAAMAGMPFHAGLQGYTKGGPGKNGIGCTGVTPLLCPMIPFWFWFWFWCALSAPFCDPFPGPSDGVVAAEEGAHVWVWVSPFLGCAAAAAEAGLQLLTCSPPPPIFSTEAMEVQRGESGPKLTAAWFAFTDNGNREASPPGLATLLLPGTGINTLRQLALELLLLRLPAPTGMFLMLPPAVQYL